MDRAAGDAGAARAGPEPRAKPVGLRSQCKAEIHAVLAKCGIQVVMSDLFGVEGTALLDRLRDQRWLPAPYAARIASLRRVTDALDFEINPTPTASSSPPTHPNTPPRCSR